MLVCCSSLFHCDFSREPALDNPSEPAIAARLQWYIHGLLVMFRSSQAGSSASSLLGILLYRRACEHNGFVIVFTS